MATDDLLARAVVDGWAEQDLPGQPWPFLAFCSISRFQQVLFRALDSELKQYEISRLGYFLLTTLTLSGRSAGLGALSRMVMVHPTTVKLTIDQLEAAGLVVRESHPTDRRATLAVLTDQGLERVRAIGAALDGAETEGPMGALNGRFQELFEALQPLRMAVGDTEL